MELQPIMNFDLKPIAPSNFRQPFNTAEFCTIRENDVYINDKLYARLNFPDYLVIAMDSKMRVIGLKPTTEEDKFGYKVQMQKTGGARVYSPRLVIDMVSGLVRGLDLHKENIRFLSGSKTGDYIIFDVDKGERVTKRANKKD